MKSKTRNKIVYQDSLITKILLVSPKYGDQECIIDTEDYNKIKDYHWSLSLEKSTNRFYVMSYFKKNNKSIHSLIQRIILDIIDSNFEGDHINHDTLDNRKNNLRKCTTSNNAMNRFINKSNKSGYKGVSWQKDRKKWAAAIKVNYKSINLGRYNNKIDAAKVYNQAALKYFGEFAYLNII
jgi:hypothetical protein